MPVNFVGLLGGPSEPTCVLQEGGGVQKSEVAWSRAQKPSPAVGSLNQSSQNEYAHCTQELQASFILS